MTDSKLNAIHDPMIRGICHWIIPVDVEVINTGVSGFGTAEAPALLENEMESAIPMKTNFSDYETALAGALIRKMKLVSNSAGAKFIVVDIPKVKEKDWFLTSLNEGLSPAIRENSAKFVSSEILAQFNGAARVHVPHGHRHMSEFSHASYASKIADFIEKNINRR